jgi:hypothetical protein
LTQPPKCWITDGVVMPNNTTFNQLFKNVLNDSMSSELAAFMRKKMLKQAFNKKRNKIIV